jgi:hypothetical protein
MAEVITYPLATPAGDTRLVGTQMNVPQATGEPNKNVTRNFTISSIAPLITSINTLGYTVYTALITQVNTAAPTAKILQNTTNASFTWARTSAGIFTVTAGSAIFTLDKTIVFANNGNDSSATGDPSIIWERTSTTVVTVTASAGINNTLTDGAFELRIYS